LANRRRALRLEQARRLLLLVTVACQFTAAPSPERDKPACPFCGSVRLERVALPRDLALELRIKELLPALLNMFSGLKDPSDLEWCELYIELVRDGYRILQLSGGGCHMTIRLENGDLIGWMGKQSEVDGKERAAFAKQIAQQYLADEAQRENKRRTMSGNV
jgi:hypothetical protein